MPPACPADRYAFSLHERLTHRILLFPFFRRRLRRPRKMGKEDRRGPRFCSEERDPPPGKAAASKEQNAKVASDQVRPRFIRCHKPCLSITEGLTCPTSCTFRIPGNKGVARGILEWRRGALRLSMSRTALYRSGIGALRSGQSMTIAFRSAKDRKYVTFAERKATLVSAPSLRIWKKITWSFSWVLL